MGFSSQEFEPRYRVLESWWEYLQKTYDFLSIAVETRVYIDQGDRNGFL
jgi:hypothetical protein